MRSEDLNADAMTASPTAVETNILNPATFPSGGPRTHNVCPTCNTEDDSIGRHFVRSDCGYPTLTQAEASALLGAWVAGAYVNPPEGRGTARLIIRANDPARLGKVQPMLGVCGRHSFKMNTQEREQLNTTPNPALEDLRGVNRSDAHLTQRAAEVLYLLRGSTGPAGDVLFTNLVDASGVAHLLRENGYSPRVSRGGVVTLVGRDAESFRAWVGQDVLHDT